MRLGLPALGLLGCGPAFDPARNPAREAIEAAEAACAESPGSAQAPWTCPMHPEVRAGEPGPCPACGMPLVKHDPVPVEME
jgi:hypothetical protein